MKLNLRNLGLAFAIYSSSILPVYPKSPIFTEKKPIINCNYNLEKVKYANKLQKNFAKIIYLEKLIQEKKSTGNIIFSQNFQDIKVNAVTQAAYLMDITPKYEHLGVMADENRFICTEFRRVQGIIEKEREDLEKLEELLDRHENKSKPTQSPKNEEEQKNPSFEDIDYLAYLKTNSILI